MNTIIAIGLGFGAGFLVSTAVWTYIGIRKTMKSSEMVTDAFKHLNNTNGKPKEQTEQTEQTHTIEHENVADEDEDIEKDKENGDYK